MSLTFREMPWMRCDLVVRCLGVALTSAVAILAHGTPALAVEGLIVKANATGGDNHVIATVYVGTSSGHSCTGRVKHAGKTGALPQLRTSEVGGGKWTWTVADNVPKGLWRVEITCQLSSGKATTTTSFTASQGRRTYHRPTGLVASGSMQAAPWTPPAQGSDHGKGGSEDDNGYKKGECTWWARLKRPDIPVFQGPAGDARHWAESARHAHPALQTGETAKPGAIVVFQPGQAGAGELGHVAYVESVKGPSMKISEANFARTKPGHIRALRWRGGHFQFIYQKYEKQKAYPVPPPETFRYYVYRTCTSGTCGLTSREGAGLKFPIIGSPLPDGTPVDIRCQMLGDRVIGFDASSSNVWDNLADGSYVPDYYVDTPGKEDLFTVPIPRCGPFLKPPPPSPAVQMIAPGSGDTLTGTVQISATSNAPAVGFAAYYSTTPGVAGSATWHTLGTDNSPADGFSIGWDTKSVPNQGQSNQNTIRIAVTALDEAGDTTAAQDVRRVAVANASGDGTYAYHVYGTCLSGDCTLNRRSGPGYSNYPPAGTTEEGGKVDIVCQAHGETVPVANGTTDIWDKFVDGTWGAGYYVDTPNPGAFSPPIPQCGAISPPPPPVVHFASPASGETLTGTVQMSATSNAPAVRFAAYYSTTPGVAGSATWHTLGTDESPNDGFAVSWDTTLIPNQGQPGQNTVQIRVTAIDYVGKETTVQDLRRVAVANVGADGTYAYHVYGTCPGGTCTVNIHSGPGYSNYPVVATKNEGDEVDIVCQAHGETVSGGNGTTDIWDKLADGAWVTDYYVDTPVAGVFSPPIPQC